MGKWFRSFRFWLSLLAVIVVIINFTQHDDYNILLALTSPVMWLAINFPAVRKIPFPTSLVYALTILFWFLIGLALDKIIRRLKSK
ncbi:hypothetical protein ABE099_10395 [Paenibacillus turicensis]|uniref:hypothetical protein n=1 Tax=Paenibacillus turicensis TaxID=160487 RepID=UPI003D2A0199